MTNMLSRPAVLFSLFLALACPAARAEDGYKLWLRYAPVRDQAKVTAYRQAARNLVVPGASATAAAIRDELKLGLSSLLGQDIVTADAPTQDGAVIVGTPGTSPVIAALDWTKDLATLGDEGYRIRTGTVAGHRATVIAANREIGALYGAFHFLRLIQTGQPIEQLDVTERPRMQRRVLNHWDNLNGSIERGFAGKSLWKWDELPGKVDPRYRDYARANASIGVNGAVLNNVNADTRVLTAEYLPKIAALADVFRPYGIRVYLSANFNAPRSLGKLATADPLDPAVIAWWKAKADEIYRIVPDFGGFLVKANSEGQPGPQGYGRTHADGANCLADALAPHGGIVMWRAFVYEESVDPDRAKRAYAEFAPLDGKFRPNVIVQVKNGPIDFQPREPFHPLFGATPHTPLMAELQITPEYFGKHRHLVYFGTMWKEFYDSDTFAKGPGSTVAKVVDGSVYPYPLTGVAGVANTGSDRNWTGHDFSQANWYAFGRLAWNPELSAERIADEWLRMTFTDDSKAIATLSQLMLSSWETFVDYDAPLGLAHLQADARDGPDPGSTALPRADWNPPYYHHADAKGIGFDRTATGSNAVSQYFPPVRDRFADLGTCPEKFLLWFHHVPWTHKMSTGRTLWEELCQRYGDGCDRVRAMGETWRSVEGAIDPERFRAVGERLAMQASDARRWRDRAVGYFQRVSGQPAPAYLAPEFPKATLGKGEVSIDLYLPDAQKGFYQGLRYDHSGMVAQARWHGHTFFGELMKPHNPKVHDHGAGTVEEFGMELHRPLGYDAAKVGGPFLKIGVGVLEKSDDPKGYGFYKDYKVLEWPAWRVTRAADWAEFAQSASLPGGRVGYELVKRLEVTADGFRIVRRLKNTGSERWVTDHYGHNYISIDEKPVGTEYGVKVGFEPKVAEQRGAVETTVSGREVRVPMPLPEGKSVWTRLEGFSDTPRDNVMRVEHEDAGVGVEISTDRPIRRWVLFALRSAICPEAFEEFEVAPGETVEWTTGYRFYARP